MPDASPASLNASPKKLKVGLIVDSAFASKYVYKLVEWANTQDDISISHLIIQDADALHPSKNKRLIQTLRLALFAFITKFESFRLKGSDHYRDHLKLFNLQGVVPESLVISPMISNTGAVYRYSAEDVQKVRNLGLDVLVRCGSGILRGDILKSTPFGIISFHHGDNRVNRGLPAGFWEVYFRQDNTGFIIQQLTEELDGGNVLIRGRFPTKSFYLLNQAILYTKSNFYLKKLLSEIAANRALSPVLESQPYFNPLYTLPKVVEQLKYILSMGLTILMNTTGKLLLRKEYRWGVAFAHSNWKTLVMRRANKIKNPPNHYLADPFVISEGGRVYCFLEDFDYGRSKAGICVYELKEKTAERLGQAIVEPFHMSFPYLFRFDSKLYMCPETSENNDIRVYECINFPLEWKLRKVLMSNLSAADTMVFQRDGVWWLLTNIDPTHTGSHYSELFAYYSDSPLSDAWQPHRGNPILIDAAKGRNAGILFDENWLYRVSQKQGFGLYGSGFSINKIVVLNKEEYLESEVCAVEPNFFPKVLGCHHLHSNGSTSAFDYLRYIRKRD